MSGSSAAGARDGAGMLDPELKDKVAVVTGAAARNGIGRAVALALAEQGAHLALPDIRLDGVRQLANEVEAMGGKALALEVDQGNFDRVRQAAWEISSTLGPIGILVNNAALTAVSPAPVSRTAPDDWDKEVRVSLNGVFYWAREVLPQMVSQSWGRIVNVASIAGICGAAGLPGYSACKGGVIAFTKSLAIETARKGITVNAVSLGFFETGIYAQGMMDADSVAAIRAELPMGRMGSPHEAAHLIAFLSSECAAYIHGANIVIDGGLSVGFTRPAH